MLRARLFGPLTVEVDGHAVPEIAGLRPRAVLAWLLLAGCAWVESASGDAAGGEKLVAAAAALPETAADPGLAAELELARGAALLRSRRFAEAERVSEHANRLARRAGRGDIADVGLIQAGAAAAARGALSRTLSLADRVLRQRCSIGLRAVALSARAYGLSRLGYHDEACAAAQDEVTLLTRLDGSPQRMTAVYDAGSVALAAGRHDEAVAQLSEALGSDSNWFPRALARLRLAEAGGRPRLAAAPGRRRRTSPLTPRPPFPAAVPRCRSRTTSAMIRSSGGRYPTLGAIRTVTL